MSFEVFGFELEKVYIFSVDTFFKQWYYPLDVRKESMQECNIDYNSVLEINLVIRVLLVLPFTTEKEFWPREAKNEQKDKLGSEGGCNQENCIRLRHRSTGKKKGIHWLLIAFFS